MIKPSKKLQFLAASVFTDLALKKAEKLHQGADLIDLSIGSPDLPPPTFVKEALVSGVQNDHEYGYAITSVPTFSEAVADFYRRRYHVSLESHNILQLMGSQDGLAHIATAYLDPGDILLAPDPGYPIYAASAHLAGAELFTFPLNEENQFMFDVNKLPDDIKKRAKIMITNYPGNPTAALATKDYFETLVQFGIENDILIIHDFAYSELLFDGNEPISILTTPGATKTAVEFNSMSKSFNMAGARIGYVVGNEKLLEPLAVVKSHMDYGVFRPVQFAAIEALTNGDTFLSSQQHLYQSRRDTLVRALNDVGWPVRSPGGGMFVWAKVPEGYTSMEFVLKALDAGVIVTPGHAFGFEGEGYVRIALVQDEPVLKAAAKRFKPLL
ncbi:LL-diaminopimelate aminotransferase [Halalkalibacterium ligniniphilum]|uniref:LL-diaminopimelate aminotransferase n=2 Tax=Halalkalibacterium ligniniphilum TaxID=1134413 RepID=UPI00034C53B2|nr:LL-diaminopimelate aminotransferase [Halalkalibacterium ligniniphilum]